MKKKYVSLSVFLFLNIFFQMTYLLLFEKISIVNIKIALLETLLLSTTLWFFLLWVRGFYKKVDGILNSPLISLLFFLSIIFCTYFTFSIWDSEKFSYFLHEYLPFFINFYWFGIIINSFFLIGIPFLNIYLFSRFINKKIIN